MKNKHIANTPKSSTPNGKPSAKTSRPKGWGPWLTKIALFATILVGAVVYTDKKHCFETTEYYKALSTKRWNALYNFAQKEPVDILLIGNSHVYNGISPEYLSTIMGCNTMILADAGIPVKDNYYALVEALKISQPRLVVLETFGMNRVVDESNNKASLIAFDARKDFCSKFSSMFHIFDVEDYLCAWSPTLRNHAYLLNGKNETEASLTLYTRMNAAPNQFYQGEYCRYNKGMSERVVHLYDSLGSSWTADYFDFDEERQLYTQKIADLCRSKGIRLMLLTLPSYWKNAAGYPEWREANAQKYAALDVPWLDLQYDYDTALFTPEAFEDDYVPNQHMTILGSIYATFKLATFIQGQGIDIPDRTKEQAWLSHFYGKVSYFESQAPLPGDRQNILLGENIQAGNASIARLILVNGNMLFAQVDKAGGCNDDSIEISLPTSYQGKRFVAPIRLNAVPGHETGRIRLFSTAIRPDVRIEGVPGR